MTQQTNVQNYSNATVVSGFLICQDYPHGVTAWISFTVFAFVLGYPAAVAVLWDLFQRGRKGTPYTPYDVFMLNISVMDWLFYSFALPALYNYKLGHNLAFQRFLNFLYSINICGRPLFTMCISLDCYLAVVHPVLYRANKRLTPRILLAVVVWTMAISHGYYTGISFDSFQEISFILLTMPVIGFCDIAMLWTLMRSNPAGGSVHPMKRKALQIIINNLLVTVSAYLPPVIAMSLYSMTKIKDLVFMCLVLYPILCCTLIGNTVTPILHLHNIGKLDWLMCWRQK